jgi:hypothetical protein
LSKGRTRTTRPAGCCWARTVRHKEHAASTRRANFGNRETSFDKDRIGSIIGGKRRYMISRATADRRVTLTKFVCRNIHGKMPLLLSGQ